VQIGCRREVAGNGHRLVADDTEALGGVGRCRCTADRNLVVAVPPVNFMESAACSAGVCRAIEAEIDGQRVVARRHV